MRAALILFAGYIVLMTVSCQQNNSSSPANKEEQLPERFVTVLGIAQDAGYPQIGCNKTCCNQFYDGKETKKYITCLALVDRSSNQYWLFEATPDITAQLHSIQSFLKIKDDYSPDGIFITHAHIGHYSGLMQLGREAMGAKAIPVWAMPRLDSFFSTQWPLEPACDLKQYCIAAIACRQQCTTQ